MIGRRVACSVARGLAEEPLDDDAVAPLAVEPPWRRYTPTVRNPARSCRARLATFSGKMRETSFQNPRASYSRASASSAAFPAPVPRALRAT